MAGDEPANVGSLDAVGRMAQRHLQAADLRREEGSQRATQLLGAEVLFALCLFNTESNDDFMLI